MSLSAFWCYSCCYALTLIHGHLIGLMSLFFYVFIFFFIYSTCNILSAGQKKASDILIDGCDPPCGCREFHSSPLEDHAMFLTAHTSICPSPAVFSLYLFVFSRQGYYVAFCSCPGSSSCIPGLPETQRDPPASVNFFVCPYVHEMLRG